MKNNAEETLESRKVSEEERSRMDRNAHNWSGYGDSKGSYTQISKKTIFKLTVISLVGTQAVACLT